MSLFSAQKGLGLYTGMGRRDTEAVRIRKAGRTACPLWGTPAGLRPRRVPAAQPPERAPHPSKCGKTAYMHRLRITVSCFLRRAAMHVPFWKKTIFRLKEKEYAKQRFHAPAGFLFGQA